MSCPILSRSLDYFSAESTTSAVSGWQYVNVFCPLVIMAFNEIMQVLVVLL